MKVLVKGGKRNRALRLTGACVVRALGLCCAPAALAQDADPAHVAELSQHRRSGVVSAWLSNGVRVHYRHVLRAPGQVVVTISLFGGEINELPDTRGLSRLTVAALDDALNPGTATDAVRRELGTRDVHADGIAAPDALMLRVWGSAEDVPTGARLAGRVLADLDATPDSLARARAAIADEGVRMDKRGAVLVGQSLIELVYPRADPRTRPVLPDELAHFTAADARAWLARHVSGNDLHAPAPVEAAVVGDLSLEQALAIARDALGHLPARPRVSPATLPVLRRPPPPSGPLERTLVADRPDGRAIVVTGFLGIDITRPSQVRLFRTAGRILQSRVRARLEAAGLIRAPEDCDAGVWLSPDPGYGMVIMLASVDSSRPHESFAILNDEVDRLAADGPEEAELAKAAGFLAAEVDKANDEDARYWSGILARSSAHGIDPDEVFAGPEFYRSITPAMLSEALQERWTPKARLGLVIRPREEP